MQHFPSGIVFIYFEHYDQSCRKLTDFFGLESVVDFGYARMFAGTDSFFIGAVNMADVHKTPQKEKAATLCFTLRDLASLEAYHDFVAQNGAAPSPVEQSPRLRSRSFPVQGPEGYRFEFGVFTDPSEAAMLMPKRP